MTCNAIMADCLDSAIGLMEEAQFAGIVFVGGCLYYAKVGIEEEY